MTVTDWEFAEEAEFSQFVPGGRLGDNVFAAVGAEADGGQTAGAPYDPDKWYLVRRTLAFI